MMTRNNNSIDILDLKLKFDIKEGLIAADMEVNTELINKKLADEIQEDITKIGQKIYDYWG